MGRELTPELIITIKVHVKNTLSKKKSKAQTEYLPGFIQSDYNYFSILFT